MFWAGLSGLEIVRTIERTLDTKDGGTPIVVTNWTNEEGTAVRPRGCWLGPCSRACSDQGIGPISAPMQRA